MTLRHHVLTALIASIAAAGIAGCRTAPVGGEAFVSGSASADDGWTTPERPTSIATPVGTPQTWSDSIVRRSTEPAFRAPPPPPPPPPGGGAAPMVVAPGAPPPATAAPCPPPCPPPAPAPCWSGCGLPCESKLSQWHVRGVIGYAFAEGTEAPECCLYWGLDIGRTFCGCWGLDAFYRYTGAEFPRFLPVGVVGVDEDGGVFHHVGVKFTYEKSINNSRFYVWGGIGPEYWWTEDYLNDDDGWGAFGEIGLGYVINQNFRIRAGLDAHWLADVSSGRFDPVDDGKGRDLWILAPVLEAEFSW